ACWSAVASSSLDPLDTTTRRSWTRWFAWRDWLTQPQVRCENIQTPVSGAQPLCWQPERIPFGQHSMAEASPEDDNWLRALVRRSPLLPEAVLRRHWETLIPHLAMPDRY